MNYKMLVTDLDGTLLDDEKNISDKNKEAIKKAQNIGVKVVISTGRIFLSGSEFAEILELDTPIIASNGAYISNKDSNKEIFKKTLNASQIQKIIELAYTNEVSFHLYTKNSIYTEKIVFSSLSYQKWNQNAKDKNKVNIITVKKDEWEKIIEKEKHKILKILIADWNEEKLLKVRRELLKLDVEVVSSFKNNIEIMNKGISKANGIEILAKEYNINRDEIISIGDSENDIAMVKYAGLGVAMENGDCDIKKEADYITLSNNNDGVAHVINEFILKV